MKSVNVFLLSIIMLSVDIEDMLTEEEIELIGNLSDELNNMTEEEGKAFVENLSTRVRELVDSIKND